LQLFENYVFIGKFKLKYAYSVLIDIKNIVKKAASKEQTQPQLKNKVSNLQFKNKYFQLM